MTHAPEEFWRWSLAVYDRPGLSDRLIALQDEFGLDVNLILWACWSGLYVGAMPELALRKAGDVSQRWSSDVVAPLRKARRALKFPPRQVSPEAAEALRARVQKSELEAERVQQAMLEEIARAQTPSDPGAKSARQNLAGYARLCAVAQKPGFSVSLLLDVLETVAEAP